MPPTTLAVRKCSFTTEGTQWTHTSAKVQKNDQILECSD